MEAVKFEVQDMVGNVGTSEELRVSVDGSGPEFGTIGGSGVWNRAGMEVNISVKVSVDTDT